MRKILVSLLVIAVAVGVVAGGTIGSFSDVDVSEGNYFSVGALDLKVNLNGIEYNDPIPMVVTSGGAWPCCSKDASFGLHNGGEGQGTAYAYLHIKDIVCSELLTDKNPTGRTEPEVVAEEGGNHGNVWVPGISELGQGNCTLADWIEVFIEFDTDGDGQFEPIIGNPMWGGIGTVYLSEVECNWIPLGELPNCNTHFGKISLHISDIPEGVFNWDHDGNTSTPDVPMDFFPDGSPLNDWPTNALMLDKATFTIEFGLFQQMLQQGQDVYYPTP